MKTIASLGDLRGKTVLLRSDLNVPLDGTTITDDGRVVARLDGAEPDHDGLRHDARHGICGARRRAG